MNGCFFIKLFIITTVITIIIIKKIITIIIIINNNKGIYKISSKMDFFILNGKLKVAAI